MYTIYAEMRIAPKFAYALIENLVVTNTFTQVLEHVLVLYFNSKNVWCINMYMYWVYLAFCINFVLSGMHTPAFYNVHDNDIDV